MVQDKLTANNSALSSMISTIVIDTVNRTTNDIIYNSYMNANNIVNADPVRTVLADFDNVISNNSPETVCGYGPNCVLYLTDHAPIYRCFGRCSVDDFNNRVFHIESSQFSIGTSDMNEIFTKIEMPNVTLLNKGLCGSFRHVGNCDYTVSIPKITELFANVLLTSSNYNHCCKIFLNSISKSYFKDNYGKLGSVYAPTSPFKEGCILHLSDGDMKCQKMTSTDLYEWVDI